MAALLDLALLVEAAFFLALCAMGLRLGIRHAAMRHVSAMVGVWALILLVMTVPPLVGLGNRLSWGLFAVAMGVWHAALLNVAVVFPRARLTGWRRAFVLATAGIPVGYLIGVLAFPGVFFDAAGVLTPTGVDLTLSIHAFPLAAPLVVFGVRWWLATDPALRTQMGYATAGFVITNLNDSLIDLLDVTLGWAGSELHFHAHSPFYEWLNLVRVAAILVIAGLALIRLVSSRFMARDASFVFGMFLLAAVLSPLQVVAGQVHGLVDGLAFFIAFYGLTRLLSLEFDWRRATREGRTMLFGVGITVLFIVQQTIEQFVGEVMGIATGAVVAGLSLALLAPLGGWLHRLHGAPGGSSVADTDAYETYRRFQIYRTALKGAVADGTTDATELRILAHLRRDLGLSEADHARLLADLGGGPAPSAAPHPDSFK